MKKLLFLALIIFCSCQSNKKEHVNSNSKPIPPPEPYFVDIQVNDVELGKPAYGDWLFSHKEKGQSFEQFMNSKHVVPTSEENIIYLQPMGDFSADQIKQIELVRQYLQIFFQLETRTLKGISNDIVPKHARRIGDMEQEQLLAGYILDSVLKKEKPQKGIALMAVTERDLYPKPEWNFVFGLASYRDRIGVSSIHRMQKEADFNLSLDRFLKICSHEIGHMFGLYHCIVADCVMNGTNSMSETDKHSLRLCSLCQRKLNSGLKYDNLKRLIELEKFFKENNLNEGLTLMKKDLEKLKSK